mmetsp:Transcript_15285/g.38599  ORF Transcript_15285/g.38599 Transcript_15285/m.38599 type:complete len:263 (-) Transcript_15285:3872-4660(-)
MCLVRNGHMNDSTTWRGSFTRLVNVIQGVEKLFLFVEKAHVSRRKIPHGRAHEVIHVDNLAGSVISHIFVRQIPTGNIFQPSLFGPERRCQARVVFKSGPTFLFVLVPKEPRLICTWCLCRFQNVIDGRLEALAGISCLPPHHENHVQCTGEGVGVSGFPFVLIHIRIFLNIFFFLVNFLVDFLGDALQTFERDTIKGFLVGLDGQHEHGEHILDSRHIFEEAVPFVVGHLDSLFCPFCDELVNNGLIPLGKQQPQIKIESP